MTGAQMFITALNMLGYTTSERFQSKALTTINQVYADIWYCVNDTEKNLTDDTDFTPLKNLADDINLNTRILHDIMPYGVAAVLAQIENDGDNQQYFTMLYNRKRAGINRMSNIVDTIPAPEGEE